MDTNKWLTPAAVVLAGLFIGGAIVWNNQHPAQAGAGAPGSGAPAPTANIADVNTAGEPYIGNANAPVTIAFWSDYQCPFCKQFEEQTLPQLKKGYVDTGKAKVVFLDFAFLGNDSITGAEYGRAVWKLYPNQYFAWRTAMFNAQDQEGDQGFGNAASIDKLDATVPGLDAAKIAADVAANKATYDAAIAADKAEAQKEGVNATPSFVIGTQLIAGAVPLAQFQTALAAVVK
ncbi:MAG: thioredoxin domain-containing protein [Patescibacteria group bacterium]|nr:thioredoxin domain-containing protein [Patescibacteria group bacterium]MDE1944283.1 thioredoxin domain-containing protein [Patescibacteria group bacterium]MDE1945120.1 thioredoxin domain-containing protein [Patescibacteria group bacterium]MDE2057636.1 thioredoxin domain-containing protein [Patescibacteria group bacterium]